MKSLSPQLETATRDLYIFFNLTTYQNIGHMAFQTFYNKVYPRPRQKPETQGTEPTQNKHHTPLQEEPQRKRGLPEETSMWSPFFW